MAQPDDEQRYARRFLLGYLAEGERQTVEERLMTDPNYMALVLQAESELMEDYIALELSEDDRKRFDKYVLTNSRQVEQLALTRALRSSARVDAAANSPPIVDRTTGRTTETRWTTMLRGKIWRVNALAAVILVTVVGIAAFIVLRTLSDENKNQQKLIGREVARLNAQQNLDPQAILHGFIIGPLKPGLSRDDENSKRFVIPTTEEVVQLRLQIGNGQYQAYRAELQTSEEREIVTLVDLKEREINGERMIVIYLPARIVPTGDYQLRLSGVNQNDQLEYIGRYTFRTVEK